MTFSPTKMFKVNVKAGQIRTVVVSALVLIVVGSLIYFLIYSVNELLFRLTVLYLLGV